MLTVHRAYVCLVTRLAKCCTKSMRMVLMSAFSCNIPKDCTLVGLGHMLSGCDRVCSPQRIAKRGHYGAFLMDDLDHVEKMVRLFLEVPVDFAWLLYFPQPLP